MRVALATFALLVAATPVAAQQSADSGFPDAFLDGFRFRSIGPAVTGGRLHDVEALPDDPSTIYIAAASGGLWKSTNKGTTWTAIFTDKGTAAFGDLAIAPSNSSIVYAGTGEQNNRQSSSWGDGVYRSDDGGTTWRHLGLVETRHIGRVRVHPSNPDIAYVAALGNLWAPSPERGVFRTTDGGASWDKVLFVDTLTGAVDLVMDPVNPDVLYAATYQRLRAAWGFNGGGPGSGIYRTMDGGATWTELTNGLPAGHKGRIGLALAPSNPRVLNATVEHATDGGVFRSTDGGETWQKVNDRNDRPMYYSHIYLDPLDENRLYKLAASFYMSEDGGRTIRELNTAPTYDVGVHGDHHAMWIDPGDTEHFYLAGDGGLYETWDRGETFMRLNNVPVAQFYDVTYDMRDPYYVYGGLQDNHSWMGPSETRRWTGIIADDWQQIGFGDGMHQQVDPTSARYVYTSSQSGNWTRVDALTGDALDIDPPEAEGEEHRFDWTSPGLVSRHRPNVFYIGGNRLFTSRDRGLSWEATEDLTHRLNPDSLSLMGLRGDTRSCSGRFDPRAAETAEAPAGPCILSKNDGATIAEITTIAESPLTPDILWVGTDDGAVQVSRDGGATWTDVSANMTGGADRPRAGGFVSRVFASGRAQGRAYVTWDMHQDGDFRPYAFRTDDFGATWTPIVAGLPTGSVRDIIEDPVNPDVLYLGTEHALYASANAGDGWTRFSANLPTTIYMDLEIHPREHDLIVGTHGRSIFILDDARPLAEWSAQIASGALHFFSAPPATPMHYWKDTSYRGHGEWNGENPVEGALLTYWLAASVPQVTVTVTDADDEVVRTFEGEAGAGLHRVAWDLRRAPASQGGFGGGGGGDQDAPDPLFLRNTGARGAFVAPGTYTVTITAGEHTATQTLEVRSDPALPVTLAQAEAREEFLVELTEVQARARDVQGRLTALRDELRPSGGARLQEVERVLARVQSLGRSLGGIASSYNGSGVRQGTMHPPTHTHRDALDAAIETLDEADALLGG